VRAVVLERFGGPEVLQIKEVDRPSPGPGARPRQAPIRWMPSCDGTAAGRASNRRPSDSTQGMVGDLP